MVSGLLVPIILLAALLAIVAIRRMRAEHRRGREFPFDHCWTPPHESVDLVHPLLRDLTILRCGYERRIERAGQRVRDGREELLVVYAFVSGFGENRTPFAYTVLAYEENRRGDSHLIATGDARLAALAMRPGWQSVRRDGRWWIASDERLLEEARSRPDLETAHLPTGITVECHPGVVAAYQSGPPSPQAVALLESAIRRMMEPSPAH